MAEPIPENANHVDDEPKPPCALCPPWRSPGNIPDRGEVCEPCRTATAKALQDLPGLYQQLWGSIGDLSGGGEKVRGSKEAPIPYRADIHDLAMAIADTLWRWEQRIRTVAKLAPAEPGPAAQTIKASAELLNRFIVALFALPQALQAGEEITALHQQARRILGLTKLQYRLPAPCPNCDLTTLVRDNGESDVHCLYCKEVYPEDRYEFLVRVLAETHKNGATA